MQVEVDEPRGNGESPGSQSAAAPPGARTAVDAAPTPGLPVPGLPDPAAGNEDPGDDPFLPEDLEALVKAEAVGGPSIHPGSRCTGVVVSVGDTDAIVSFGAKVEGRVPLEEFRGPGGDLKPEPGQQIDVVVERLGAPGVYAVLSHRRVREAAAWSALEAAYAQRTPVQARILGRVKGGLRVDVGVAAFLPGSQLDIRPVKDPDAWIDRTVEVLVIDCNRRRSNAVVSRSELLKAERRQRMAEALERLAEGEPATGTVKNITKYGVFVDLGGIDGLIKLPELSHGRVGNPSNMLQSGEEVTARVLKIDVQRERVALSLRAMHPDPWASIAERISSGSRVQGRVASIEDYGAFVELEPGVEGLIHISEIDWSRHPKHPSKTFEVGAEIEAVILSVSPEKRRISLSFKRLAPDPWVEYGPAFEIGQVLSGTVRQITTYGLFVEVVEGIEGLVHVSDLSWDSRQPNPREFARKGQQINAVILQVDLEKRRLSLGVKQLEPDAWDTFLSQAAVGDSVPGTVRKQVEYGAFVELAPGVQGLCHTSQFPKGSLRARQTYNFEILEVNERSRRIRLRCRQPVPLDVAEPGSLDPDSQA